MGIDSGGTVGGLDCKQVKIMSISSKPVAGQLILNVAYFNISIILYS